MKILPPLCYGQIISERNEIVMYIKDFGAWHDLKQKIETSSYCPLFREREIWWCHLGMNIGDEEDGKNRHMERPVIVIRKFNRRLFLGLPLTTKTKNNRFYYIFNFQGRNQCAILSQIRALSAKRIINRVGKIDNQQFTKLKESLIKTITADPIKDPPVPSGNL